MCQYEVIHFRCNHAGRRLIKHCHFARNDPYHQCGGTWSIKREWVSANQVCQNCGQARLQQQQQYQQQQQQQEMMMQHVRATQQQQQSTHQYYTTPNTTQQVRT